MDLGPKVSEYMSIGVENCYDIDRDMNSKKKYGKPCIHKFTLQGTYYNHQILGEGEHFTLSGLGTLAVDEFLSPSSSTKIIMESVREKKESLNQAAKDVSDANKRAEMDTKRADMKSKRADSESKRADAGSKRADIESKNEASMPR